MIPAPKGLAAHFTGPGSDRPVIAFTDDGVPLIVSPTKHHNQTLVPANRYTNYEGVGTDPCPDIVQIMTAGGWRVETTLDDGTTRDEPLVGWGLKANGQVVPLDVDETGHVDDFDLRGDTYRIYHPSTSETNPHAAAKALSAEHAADTGATP